MTAAELGRQLHGHKAGACWMGKCPSHDDRSPSLAIRERDGRLLVHCHSGCDQRDVIAALRARGLWPEKDRTDQPERWKITATYPYTDEAGEVLFEILRKERISAGYRREKKMLARRPDGAGGWIWNMQGVRHVPYRLPEVLEAPIVFIVEGEKDVETLRAWGFAATTNPFGAESWNPDFNRFFAGREVIILPDRDAPGWKRAKAIAKQLLGKVARLIIIDLEDGKDVTEWFERGHSELELIAHVEGEEVSR